MVGSTDYLRAGIADLYKSGDHSDVTVTCGWFQFAAHRNILGAQSDFFKAACKKGTFKEGMEGIINLKATGSGGDGDDESCDDPVMVDLLMKYFYHGNYLTVLHGENKPLPHTVAPNAIVISDEDGAMLIHAHAFAIAVKYQVRGLQHCAAEKFKQQVAEKWDTNTFPQAIYLVYTSTIDQEDALRRIVVQAILKHRDLSKKPEIIAAMNHLHRLCYALLTTVPEKRPYPQKINCAVCFKTGRIGLLRTECTRCGKRSVSCCTRCDDDHNDGDEPANFLCKQCYEQSN